MVVMCFGVISDSCLVKLLFLLVETKEISLVVV